MSAQNITIALAGNPNSGKSSMFNALTGARQHVGNYPGVTVEKKWGQANLDDIKIDVIDLPGTYSLTAYSQEELVARNFIIQEKPDVVVDVVDASNLERNLYLALQFMELGVPVVIALNMMDVAKERGIQIDSKKLSKLLGVPVVPTVARKGQGVGELLTVAAETAALKQGWNPLDISYGSDVDQALQRLVAKFNGQSLVWQPLSPRWVGLKLLENDPEVLRQVKTDPGLADKLAPLQTELLEHIHKTLDDEPASVIADYRYGYINSVYRQAVHEPRAQRLEASDKVDKVLTNRLLGPVILLAILYGVYEFVFWASWTWGACPKAYPASSAWAWKACRLISAIGKTGLSRFSTPWP